LLVPGKLSKAGRGTQASGGSKVKTLAAMLASALTLLASGHAFAQPKTLVQWGAPVVQSSYYWDVWGAIELGYLAEEGLDVKVTNNDTPIQCLQFLATGALDIGSPLTDVAISAIDKGADFSFVAAEDAHVAFALMGRPEIAAYQDLRGKTLGVTQLEETTATLIQLLLAKHGLQRKDYEFLALGGSPNRYAALVRGAVAATMLSPPFDFKAEADGMRRMGNAFEAFDGVGIVYAVQRSWGKAHADTLVRFLRAVAKAQRFFYDPANKQKAVDILVKVTKSPPEDIGKSYDSFYRGDRLMAVDLALTEPMLQPWLALRGSTEKPSRYIDNSYWKQALGR
jgi:NitT/TauT family transport system substrate-binding protein